VPNLHPYNRPLLFKICTTRTITKHSLLLCQRLASIKPLWFRQRLMGVGPNMAASPASVFVMKGSQCTQAL
jgi:hypothetical protein